MAENENVVELNEVQPAPESTEPSKGAKFLAGVKEWFRKFIVKLKRRPMNIAFFVLIVSTVFYLCSLTSLSQTALNMQVDWIGLSMFVNTLFSILMLMLFLNAFPKRSPKPKIVMLVLLFVFMAASFAFDMIFYFNVSAAYNADIASGMLSGDAKAKYDAFIIPALTSSIVHAVFLAVSAVLTATYPLYGKLIGKINTRKVVESNEMKEEIDTSAEV